MMFMTTEMMSRATAIMPISNIQCGANLVPWGSACSGEIASSMRAKNADRDARIFIRAKNGSTLNKRPTAAKSHAPSDRVEIARYTR